LPKERANRPLLTVVRGRPQSAVGSARGEFLSVIFNLKKLSFRLLFVTTLRNSGTSPKCGW